MDVGVRGMHLAYQVLEGYRVLVVVDAVRARTGRPGRWPARARPGRHDRRDAVFDPHGMEPDAVLELVGALARGVGTHGGWTGCSSSGACRRTSARAWA